MGAVYMGGADIPQDVTGPGWQYFEENPEEFERVMETRDEWISPAEAQVIFEEAEAQRERDRAAAIAAKQAAYEQRMADYEERQAKKSMWEMQPSEWDLTPELLLDWPQLEVPFRTPQLDVDLPDVDLPTIPKLSDVTGTLGKDIIWPVAIIGAAALLLRK